MARSEQASPAHQERPDQLRVGRLTKAHGLKGAIKVELYTDDPERRFSPGAEFLLQVPESSSWHGKTLRLIELRWYNSHPVAFFQGVEDRNAAEELIKAILWIEQDLTEGTGEDDAWYDHQLVGLSVIREGVEVGTVARLEHLPAQDLLIVNTPAGEVMVPFVSAIVPTVDVQAGRVIVTPPRGLFEADEAEIAAPSAAGLDDESADPTGGDSVESELPRPEGSGSPTYAE
ncbi:ribosome maturation factor RimM [Klugiella xanthotipulae]|uniref:Ribosome maturation factor RimM n=1 Tax=Klugiella xanthotipulae TaxID=244735 RepID=A0A543HRV1_9MICO|nr:ribosome maturation factor RimM [Klugiella xanthotipulae]TQM61073.1 16S rRNA processing protein RimM [Klugiella xanthotipulae]